MQQDSGSPSDQFADMKIEDDDLPQYVSSGDEASAVGSSVSQTNKNTVEISAAMFADAVSMIQGLTQEVLTMYLFIVSILTIVFNRLQV